MGSLVLILSAAARRLTPLAIMVRERTFIAVKPDGVQRNLTGEIIKRFEAKGFKLAGMKFLQASEDLLKQHYADLSDKPFYAGLCKYMASGPVVAMCWEGTGIPNLTKDGSDETAKTILKPFGLGVRGLGGEHTPIGADGTVDISPKARFCISEAQIAIALYKGVEKVIAEEQAAGN